MSNYKFFNGQTVSITEAHGHFKACNDTKYQVGAVNRVQGFISVQLLHNGVSVGAVPERKLQAK